MVNKAIEIIERRAKAENQTFNKEATYWMLLGILSREGEDAVIEFATTAPFQKKPRRIIGYGGIII